MPDVLKIPSPSALPPIMLDDEIDDQKLMLKNPLLRLFWKEKMIILTALALGIVGVLVYLLGFYTPLYSSSVKLFIRNIPRSSVVADFSSGALVRSESGYSNPLFNYIQILHSEKLSRRIYQNLEKKFSDDFRKFNVTSPTEWHDSFGNLIESKVVPSTDIIKVDFSWNNPSHAPAVLNELIQQFKKTNLEIQKSVEIQQREYLDQQLDAITDELHKVRQEIRNYRLANKSIDITNEITELTRARVELEKQAELLRSDISRNMAKQREYASQLGVRDARTALRSAGIGEDPYLVALNRELAGVEQRYAKLQAKYTDSYPDVVEALNEMNSLKANISRRLKETLGAATRGNHRGIYDGSNASIATDLARVQAEGISLQSQLKTLTSGISNLKSKEAEFPEKSFGLSELEKKEAALITAYNNIKQKQIEAKIHESEIVDNIVVLDPPTPPSLEVKPIALKIGGILLLALFLGAGIAWVKEGLQDQWVDEREIEETTGKKVLGMIPWLKRFDQKNGENILTPNSAIGRAYHHIANSIINKAYLENAHALSFMTTVNSRDRSSIVTNVSATLATLNRSVLLVDTDFQNPNKLLHALQIPSREQGRDLIDVVQEMNRVYRFSKEVEKDVLHRMIMECVIPIRIDQGNGDFRTFHYLCASKPNTNTYELVASSGFQLLIQHAKTLFEFVLVDTPNVPPDYPEMAAITSSSDAVVLIAAMASNRERLIRQVYRFDRAAISTLGIIAREAH